MIKTVKITMIIQNHNNFPDMTFNWKYNNNYPNELVYCSHYSENVRYLK